MRFRVFETGSRRSFGLLLGSALMVSLLVTMAANRGAIADDWGSETPGTVAVPALTPAETRLKADVSYLAADAREGRAPGTKGIEDAALYIAEKFKRFGLKPAQGADGYFQKFPLTGRPRLGEPTELAILEPDGKILKAEPKTEFSPLAIGSSGSVDHLPIVFAGYGITAKDSAPAARL